LLPIFCAYGTYLNFILNLPNIYGQATNSGGTAFTEA